MHRWGVKDKPLTEREKQIYELLLTGLTLKQIGAKIFIDEKTVKYHNTHIYKKIQVKNRTELMAQKIKELKHFQEEPCETNQ